MDDQRDGLKTFFYIPRKDMQTGVNQQQKANQIPAKPNNAPHKKGKVGGWIALLLALLAGVGVFVPNPLQKALLQNQDTQPATELAK